MKLEGRSALVVGLGKSGVAAARLLIARGARVFAADDKPASELAQPLQLLGLKDVRPVAPKSLRDADLVVVSPGVPPTLRIFAEARARGLQIIGEVELAARFIDEPILGVTGTNGKSTTTALCGHLLKSAGLRVFVGGNLGNALSNRVLEGDELDATVCELSSYQLETVEHLRCAAAVVLNVTPDHLDRYPSLEAYAAAKARIFERQQSGDMAVLNLADARVAAMRTEEHVARMGFDPRFPRPETPLPPRTLLAGFLKGPRTLHVVAHDLQLRVPTLRGAHNAENAFAACLLAFRLGLTPLEMQRGLDTYPGLPHRLEPVRVLDGVEWINDSKATNVDSVEKSLGAFDANVILIIGGRGKGAPYAPLRALFGRVKALLTVGEDAKRIAAELGDAAPVTACGDLSRAVAKARSLARAGDVVLLSPACASYDQFKNFEDRGEQFKRMVGEL
ncbi:MAG TPA: UDP-N-acetylmuramoyl-L-alanine--D-glutamate ligase [Myxococcales bacterium]